MPSSTPSFEGIFNLRLLISFFACEQVRMKEQVIQSVLNEQVRQELNSESNHPLIALKSMERSKALKDRALAIGMFHEMDAMDAH